MFFHAYQQHIARAKAGNFKPMSFRRYIKAVFPIVGAYASTAIL